MSECRITHPAPSITIFRFASEISQGKEPHLSRFSLVSTDALVNHDLAVELDFDDRSVRIDDRLWDIDPQDAGSIPQSTDHLERKFLTSCQGRNSLRKLLHAFYGNLIERLVKEHQIQTVFCLVQSGCAIEEARRQSSNRSIDRFGVLSNPVSQAF